MRSPGTCSQRPARHLPWQQRCPSGAVPLRSPGQCWPSTLHAKPTAQAAMAVASGTVDPESSSPPLMPPASLLHSQLHGVPSAVPSASPMWPLPLAASPCRPFHSNARGTPIAAEHRRAPCARWMGPAARPFCSHNRTCPLHEHTPPHTAQPLQPLRRWAWRAQQQRAGACLRTLCMSPPSIHTPPAHVTRPPRTVHTQTHARTRARRAPSPQCPASHHLDCRSCTRDDERATPILAAPPPPWRGRHRPRALRWPPSPAGWPERTQQGRTPAK